VQVVAAVEVATGSLLTGVHSVVSITVDKSDDANDIYAELLNRDCELLHLDVQLSSLLLLLRVHSTHAGPIGGAGPLLRYE
jgi:hypothetical protein